MGLGVNCGAGGPGTAAGLGAVSAPPSHGQQHAERGSVMLGATLANPIASKAAQLQHAMKGGGDGWQHAVIATLEQSDPAERIAIERLLPMSTLIEKLSAWEATRLGVLGPVPESQELLNHKRVAYFKQVLDDYPPSYAQVFLIYALQAACLDEASQIVAELANARRLSKLRALPAVAQRLTSIGVDLSVFQEPSESWTRVFGGAGRSISRFAKDDRPGKYGSQKAELPAEYSEALNELELGDAIGSLSPGDVAMGGFDEVTFGVPRGVVDLGRSTIGGVRDLALGEYEQAGEQLAGAGVIVLTHLGIKAWNVSRRVAKGGTKAGSATVAASAPGLRGPEGPGQFTLASFQGPITAEEAKLGAIFGLNAEAQAALGRILSRIGRGGLEKVATMVSANSRAALIVAEHGEAGLYALLEADGEVGTARAKLTAGGQTTQAPLALPAADGPANTTKPTGLGRPVASSTNESSPPTANEVARSPHSEIKPGKAFLQARKEALEELLREAETSNIDIRSDSEAVEYLDWVARREGIPPENVHAVTLGNLIFVRPEHAINVRILREEMIHVIQQRGAATAGLVEHEIEARLLMIRFRHKWAISVDEINEMIKEIRSMRNTGRY
jgi:hypothetical protein